MSIRQEKFGKLIQKELAEIFMQHKVALFGNAFITVSNVTMSPDLGYAKVYLSFFNETNKEALLLAIEQQRVVIRKELATRIRKQVRVIPDLQFFIDDSLDYVFKMEQLFNKIKKQD